MPNKQSRTQNKRKTQGSRSMLQSAAGPVWPVGRPSTELKTYAFTGANYQLYHNTAVPLTNVANLFNNIVLGTNVIHRIGCRIRAERLRMHIVFNNKLDRPNVSYRVAVTASPAAANTDTFSELFNAGGTTATFTGLHAPTTSLLLHDAVFPLNQGSGMESNTNTKERSFNHALDIPLGKSVVYNINDQTAMTALSVWLIAYDAYGTLATDNIASVASVTWAIDFTDA